VIHSDRVKDLNGKAPLDGAYVLYWMQQSQRAGGNPALELAIREANARRLPVVVGFGLMDDYPEANARHYTFLLQGMRDVAAALRDRGIAFVVRRGRPDDVALALGRDAALIVCDRGYLRHQRAWRDAVASNAGCAVIQVEGDVVVPVELASGKSEYAARTLRPKILRHRDLFMSPIDEGTVDHPSLDIDIAGDIDVADVDRAIGSLAIDHNVRPVRRLTGGTTEARSRLAAFLRVGFAGYADGRNEPADWRCSFMSPYLHFGQLSPVEVALAVRDAREGPNSDAASYLEELIVRRELAANFVQFEPAYDRFEALPNWARQTLGEHSADQRAPLYAPEDLEAGETHDRYWNAAMREMVHTGFMHNYMRMYWGKKILEWSPSPEEAYETTLRLNNKYFLDGRDPNSYANVAWCYGLHDRPWMERPIFGKVRYMNAAGLKRKFDIDRYVAEVDRLVAAEAD